MFNLYCTQVALIICYILSLLFFVFRPLKEKQKPSDKIILILLGFFLVIAAVTRPEETADTDNYIYGFTKGDYASRMEPMYAFIIAFSRLFSYPAVIGLSIYAILSIVPRLYFIKKYSVNIFASVIIYLSYCYIAQDIVAIRSGVASALLLLAIHFKFQEKYKYMFCIILIASLFHYTALAFLVLYFINQHKKQRVIYLLLLACCYFLYFVNFDIRLLFPYLQYLTFLEHNISSYSDSTEMVFGTLNGPQILRISTCVLFWVFADKIYKKNQIKCSKYFKFRFV